MGEAVARIDETVESLQSFSRLDEADIQAIDLRAELDNVLKLVRAEARAGATIERNYDEIPDIYGMSRDINQALLTVVTNAFEALDGEGTVTLSTGVDGEVVFARIADTGTGLDAAQREAIFDVSLGARDERVGAGFGLLAAQNIAHRHAGHITVESEPGEGATFTLRFPVGRPGDTV
jgi:signal transduction histidine kinase